MLKTAFRFGNFLVVSSDRPAWARRLTKTLIVMKLTVLLLTVAVFTANARGTAQNVTISGTNVPLQKVFSAIEKQTGYAVLANRHDLAGVNTITLSVFNLPLTDLLDVVLKDQPLEYTIKGKTIVLSRKATVSSSSQVVSSDRPATPLAQPPVRVRVTGADGQALAGASVTVKNSKNSGVTDADGVSTINANVGDVITVSYVGFESQSFTIKNNYFITVTLSKASTELNEVVIGYGTTTKIRNTGSISSIGAEEIAKQPVANPLNALQGRIAGALVTQANGLPGSRVTIVVRGLNTTVPTGAGAQPLYIVDGVPFNIQDGQLPISNDLNGRGSYVANGGVSPFSMINPADIERIDVLKDADATAIYGTRGANGVVLITTKKGRAGKTRLEVNVYRGVGKVGHFIPMMSNQQYREMRYEAFRNDGITPTVSNAPDLKVWDSTFVTDWQRKYLGGTAKTTDAQATVSGGDERTRFLLNAGYHKETTVFPGDFSDYRIAARMNVDHSSKNKKFNANITISNSFGRSNLLQRDLSSLYNLVPNLPLYDASGKIAWVGNYANPEAYLLEKYVGKTNNMMTNAVLRYTILRGLDIKTSFGYNSISLEQNTQLPASSKNPFFGSSTNSANFANLNQRSYILEPQITYNTNLGRGQMSALLGSTFQHSLNNSLSLSADNYSTAVLLGTPTGAGSYSSPVSSYTLYRYNSIFGRVTYDWESKYILNVVLRRDGSSRFGPSKRFGNFWSLGAGWVFSNEDFAKASMPWLSFGKVRASYGLTGNDQIADYLYRSLYTARTSYQNGSAIAPNRLDNPSLHWQTTNKMEFGIELGFIRNAIQLTANYYRNSTSNQLGGLGIPSQTGFASISTNIDALTRNTGFEFELSTVNVTLKDFKWSSAFNLTIPRTKVVSANTLATFYNPLSIGQQLSYLMRVLYRGVDPSTGAPRYADLKNDTLTYLPDYSTDRVVVGYTAPKAYGGFNNTFTYKNLDVSFFFQFTIQDGNYLPVATPGVLTSGNVPTYWLDRWRKPGDITNVPRYATSGSIYGYYASSNVNFGNASIFRLRNVNISYRLPSEWAKRIKTDNLRVYLQGQNLWWASRNKYVYDPETGTSMPPLRVITAGINVSL